VICKKENKGVITMRNLKLVELLELDELNMLKLKSQLLKLNLEATVIIQDTIELIDLVIDLKQVVVKAVDYEIDRRKTDEEKAISLAVSKIQDIAMIYDIDASTKDRKELINIVTKAYKEKSEINSN